MTDHLEYLSLDDPRLPEEMREGALAYVADYRNAKYELVEPTDLLGCIVALQRKLLVDTPKIAERKWWHGQQVAKEMRHARIEVAIVKSDPIEIKVRHGNRSDVWFATHELEGGIVYQQFGDNAGQTRWTRPEGLSDEYLIHIFEPKETNTTLRNFLVQLEGKLTDPSAIAAQKSRSHILDLLYGPKDNAFSASLLMKALADGLRTIKQSKCDDLIAGVEQGFINFRIDGRTASNSCLLLEIINQAHPEYRFVVEELILERLAIANAQRVGDFLSAFAEDNRGVTWIKAAASVMQEKGAKLQQEALNAKSLGGFYGNLYKSCIWLWGAVNGHRFLAGRGRDPTGESKVAANVCEEWLVVASTTMFKAFLDSMDGRHLIADRELIANQRKKGGIEAAEAFVHELIEIQMSYPRSFRANLLQA